MRWIAAGVLSCVRALVATESSSPATAASATSSYVAVNPTRLVDTRSGLPVQANIPADFQITGGLVRLDHRGDLSNAAAALDQIDDATT